MDTAVNMQALPLVIEIIGDKERGDQMRATLTAAVDSIAHDNPHLIFQKVEAKSNGPQIRRYTAYFREAAEQ